MSSRKSYTQKQRDKRIQKQVENLGGPKKITEPKTLKKAVSEAYERANIIARFPFSSGDEGSMLDMAGYKPASPEEKKTGLLQGTTGLFKENVPKQLRDRLKEEKVQKKEAGGEIAKPKKRPKKDPFKADKTEIINEEFSKKVARQNAKNKETGKANLKNLPGSKESLEDNDDIFKKVKKMKKGGEAVPSKYKGFSKLPKKVQQKINPNLASKYEYGGSVKGKGGKMMCRGQGAAIKGGGFSIR